MDFKSCDVLHLGLHPPLPKHTMDDDTQDAEHHSQIESSYGDISDGAFSLSPIT